MTRAAITAIALLSLFLIFGSNAVWSRWVSAAGSEYQDPDRTVAQSNFKNEEEFEGADYLRLRDEYVGMRRGIDPQRGLPDPRLRERAIDQMKRQERVLGSQSLTSVGEIDPSVLGGAWTPLGPAPLPNGNFAVPVSGRAVAIAVDPTNANIVYIGAAQGGVWRSLDGGQTWATIFDSADSLAIGAIAIAPSDPSIVYVGTGEPSQSGDSFFGVGLYRIENANGPTPNLIGPINPLITSGNGALSYNAFTGRSISKILVHPNDPATIFVSTATGVGGRGSSLSSSTPPLGLRGVFRSNNATAAPASVAFTKLTVTTDNSGDSPGTGNASVIDMVMEPGNPDNLLAAVIGLTGTGGIYQTTTALTTATFTQRLALSPGIRVELAINKVGSTVTVYAATGETPTNTPGCTGTNSGAVRKSVDGGASWSAQLTGGGGYCGGQCGYDIAIAVHPTNPNLLYLGGQARGTCSDAMKRSTDGGATFVRDDATTLHPDSHALAFDSTGNTIFTTSDGGVWKATVPGSGGTPWIDLNLSPLNTLQFVGIAVHPFDRNIIIGGTQDNGTELQPGGGGSWTNTAGGDGGYALIDQSATDTTNVTMYHTFFFSSGSQIRYQRTSTVGGSWTNIGCAGTPANGINCTDAVLFYAPMTLGPGNPNAVYLGTDRIYRSTDRGDTHEVVSQAPIVTSGCATPTGSCPITTIAVSPQDDNYRIVGLQNGDVWATTSSSTLVKLGSTNSPFPANAVVTSSSRFVGRVLFDPNNKDVAYVAFSYFAQVGAGLQVWKITNFTAAVANPSAANWTATANGIPNIPVSAFAVDPANSNSLFAGTDIGVFNSSDGGATWAPYGTGLPRVAVFDMAIQNANRVLRVGTHGRGVWEISLSGGAPPSPTPTPTPTATPANNNFANAQVISGCGGTVPGTNIGATKEPGEPNHEPSGNLGGASVWYQWTAPASASVTITTVGSNFDTLLAVYTGNSLSGLTACPTCKNDDVNFDAGIYQSSVTFNATAGTTYKIAVDGYNLTADTAFADTGNIVLNWQMANCAAPSLIVEDGTSNLAAVDSVTLVHGPFALTDNYNFSFDQRRRITFFTTDLGFAQLMPVSMDIVSVQINGVSNPVESVGPNATLGGSQIVFRLPNLNPGTYQVGLRVRGVNSTNNPNIAIVATSPSSPELGTKLAGPQLTAFQKLFDLSYPIRGQF